MVAYALIKRVNKKRYAKLQASLANAYTLGENWYPNTVEKVMAILNGYKAAQPMPHNLALMQINKNRKLPDEAGLDGIIHAGIKCRTCSNMGHYTSKCPDKKPLNAENQIQ